jgi:hypothetical protein
VVRRRGGGRDKTSELLLSQICRYFAISNNLVAKLIQLIEGNDINQEMILSRTGRGIGIRVLDLQLKII